MRVQASNRDSEATDQESKGECGERAKEERVGPGECLGEAGKGKERKVEREV